MEEVGKELRGRLPSRTHFNLRFIPTRSYEGTCVSEYKRHVEKYFVTTGNNFVFNPSNLAVSQ